MERREGVTSAVGSVVVLRWVVYGMGKGGGEIGSSRGGVGPAAENLDSLPTGGINVEHALHSVLVPGLGKVELLAALSVLTNCLCYQQCPADEGTAGAKASSIRSKTEPHLGEAVGAFLRTICLFPSLAWPLPHTHLPLAP